MKLHCFFIKYLLPELMTQKLKFKMNAEDDDELENDDEAVSENESENELADEPELYCTCICRAAEIEKKDYR